ncbi:MAG TPA: lysylphosphatidylglycerol synthase domain-containing protein [Minicystis sp.]|nr:lysylphosphatidylglycerol synthase domain-containing protein [Minicystis sp.]
MSEADDPRAKPAAVARPRHPAVAMLLRVLPFALAIGLVAFVLSRLDLAAFRAHLASVDAPRFVAFAVIFLLSLLSADAFATVLVYRRSVAPVTFGNFWVLRGASYVPSLLNHHVGQAFITVALARRHGIALARMAGATLVVYASWMGCVAGLLVLALVMRGGSPVWPALVVAAGVAYLAVIEIRPRRLAKISLLAPLFEARAAGHLVAMAARLPHLVVLFLGTWLPFFFFGVRVPFADALETIPVLMVAVTLPITPQGFGTRDVLAQLFYERFAPGATHAERLAAITAATTSWGVAVTLLEAAFGLALLYGVVRRRRDGGPPGA